MVFFARIDRINLIRCLTKMIVRKVDGASDHCLLMMYLLALHGIPNTDAHLSINVVSSRLHYDRIHYALLSPILRYRVRVGDGVSPNPNPDIVI